MPEQIGKLISCTRCPTNVFLKQTGTVGLSNYAGPGSRPVYEELPKTWMFVSGLGYLCPQCTRDMVSWLKNFLGEDKYEKLGPCWKIEEE